MNNSFDFGEFEVVSSKDELNYERVIDDFQNAKRIFVTTYNISQNKGQLLKLLDEHSSHAEVTIITNIPKRFDRYYSTKARSDAATAIESYTDQLDPLSKIGDMSVHFNFSNHTKIVMTDNIAYIGSANYSSESKSNRETGILLKNPTHIQLLFEQLVPILTGESIEYTGTNLGDIELRFGFLLAEIRSQYDRIRESTHSYVEGHYTQEIEIYNRIDPNLSVAEISELIKILSELQEEIENLEPQSLKEKVEQVFDTNLIDDIVEIVSNGSPINELASFSVQKCADTYIEEHTMDYDTDDSEALMETAVHQAMDRLSTLSESVEPDIEDLFEKLDALMDGVAKSIRQINHMKQLEDTIDNTK